MTEEIWSLLCALCLFVLMPLIFGTTACICTAINAGVFP